LNDRLATEPPIPELFERREEMDFTEYWDKQIEEYRKVPAIFDKPFIMNAIYDAAFLAWEFGRAEKERECEKLKKVVVMTLGCGSYAEHDYTCFEIAQAARQALEGGEK
jgi:hypothetical protein